MRRFLVSSVVLVLVLTPCARADFVITLPAQPAADTTPVFSVAGPMTDTKPGELAPRQGRHPIEPRFGVARGFGDHIPLRFAVRQIVPPALKVIYGPGVSRNMVVSWKGGDGWDHVLSKAVRPLGLRLVMTDMAVEIRQ